MKVIELLGKIDEHHRLEARVPENLPVGPVRLIVLLPEWDNAELAWALRISEEWTDELADPRQDLYTIEDGKAVNVPW